MDAAGGTQACRTTKRVGAAREHGSGLLLIQKFNSRTHGPTRPTAARGHAALVLGPRRRDDDRGATNHRRRRGRPRRAAEGGRRRPRALPGVGLDGVACIKVGRAVCAGLLGACKFGAPSECLRRRAAAVRGARGLRGHARALAASRAPAVVEDEARIQTRAAAEDEAPHAARAARAAAAVRAAPPVAGALTETLFEDVSEDDVVISKRSGVVVVDENQCSILVEQCRDCRVYVPGHARCVRVVACVDCLVYVGAARVASLTHCARCVLAAAARRRRRRRGGGGAARDAARRRRSPSPPAARRPLRRRGWPAATEGALAGGAAPPERARARRAGRARPRPRHQVEEAPPSSRGRNRAGRRRGGALRRRGGAGRRPRRPQHAAAAGLLPLPALLRRRCHRRGHERTPVAWGPKLYAADRQVPRRGPAAEEPSARSAAFSPAPLCGCRRGHLCFSPRLGRARTRGTRRRARRVAGATRLGPDRAAAVGRVEINQCVESRRWPGNVTPSSRRSYGENCVGRRDLISTRVAAAAREAFATWLVREGAELRDVVDLLRFPARPA